MVRLAAARQIPAFLQRYFDEAPLWRARGVRIGDGLWPLLERCWSRSERERAASSLCRALIAAPGSGWLDEQDVIEGMARGGDWPDPSRLEGAAIAPFVEAVLEELAIPGAAGLALRLELRFVLAPPAVQTRFALEALSAALREEGLDEAGLAEHLLTRRPDLATLEGCWTLEAGRGARSLAGDRRVPTRAFRIGLAERGLDLRLSCGRPLAGYFRLTLESVAAAPAIAGL